jgi:protein O-mannosyl-transferase
MIMMVIPKNSKFPSAYNKPVLCFLLLLLIVTFLVYKNLLFAEFLDYDDLGNVVQNKSITSLSIKNIKTIFTSSVYYSYNPATFLSYAIDYQLFGMNPIWFHFTNILLHLVNILLVFRFTQLLTGIRISALVTATLFALHPIHADVVGWISARNYLLCTLFYLLSLIYYIQYLNNAPGKKTKIILSLLFFILACLSKSQAVTLAPIILLIDWIFKVRNNFRCWIIIGIYFCIAVTTGLFTIYFRADMGQAEIIPNYTSIDKVFVICFSLVKYIWKLVFPIGLAAIDSFPGKSNGGLLPVMVYFSPVVMLIAVVIIVRLKKVSPVVLTCILFFILNVAITQITFLEDGFSANRYIYLSSVGMYIPVAMMVVKFFERTIRYRYWLIAGCGILLVLLMRITYLRSGDWKNTLTLSSSIIEKSPDAIMAYNIRGIWYYNQKDYDLSIQDFNDAISNFPNYSSAYYNRGLSMSAIQNHTEALKDYDRAIDLNPNFVSAYLARGIIMLDIQKNYPKAIENFNKVLSLKPDYPQAYYNLGLTYFRMQNLEEACENWQEVKQLGYSQADGMIAKYCR